MASAYTTQAQILGNIQMPDLISLTDDSNTGNLDNGVLNQVIANASGVVDMYSANIYGSQLPFNPVPLAVANIALVIACYMLYERREVPMEKNKFGPRYVAAVKFLEGVNVGKFHFDDTTNRDYSQVAATGRATIYGAGNVLANSM